MPIYKITHKTTYYYASQVSVSHHSAHLKPLDTTFQNCENFYVEVFPICNDLLTSLDYFGNTVHTFSIQEPHQSLTVISRSQVTVNLNAPDLSLIEMTHANAVDKTNHLDSSLINTVREFLYPTERTPISDPVKDFASRAFTDDKPVGMAILDLLDIFKDEFTFDPTATEVSTPIEEVLESKSGVCQDFAHLMLAAVRASGLCARYVSGYILSHPPAGMARLEGADASHAWISIYIPDFGWVEVDPTNRIVCTDQHVRVAYGRDYGDVSMIKGAVTGGGFQTVQVEVTMMPIDSIY